MVKCIQDFHATARLPRAFSSAFLVIVPKTKNPQGLEEYRQICLIGCLYKVIYRILAPRLRCVISSLISKSRTTLIPGRQIVDGVVVINDLLDYAKRKKKSCLLFKVDFAQTYDCCRTPKIPPSFSSFHSTLNLRFIRPHSYFIHMRHDNIIS